HVAKYEPVANKVGPVVVDTPIEFRVERKMVGEPIADLLQLPAQPPERKVGDRLSRGCGNSFDWDSGGFLWPEG
ncbi:hypothetical protein PISMIDRAFT_123823, partial [Pisolithus microcarpus 441]